MFDPTIYENIKVVLEGEIYELDLSGDIQIVARKDIIDLAQMARVYTIQFSGNQQKKGIITEIQLSTGIEDLAKEILEDGANHPGAEIIIKWIMDISNPSMCERIEDMLNDLWDFRPKVEQKLSYYYHKNEKIQWTNEITLNFGRKINEEHIEDIHDLIEYSINSMRELLKVI